MDAEHVSPFRKNEMVFELRSNMKAGLTVLLYFAFIGVPIFTMILLKVESTLIILPVTFAGITCIIYYMTTQNKKGPGFYLAIENGMAKFLDLKSEKELFATSLSNITTNAYIIKFTTKYSSYYYLTLKVKVPGFKTFAVGQLSNIGNIWKGKGFPVKWLLSVAPRYIIDADSWHQLAKAFGIKV